MFDNTCKYLAEQFSSDFANWLLGHPQDLTTLEPTELSLEPIRADSVILLQAEDVILHLEFQTQPDETMAFRMLDYRVRLYRRYPQHCVKQVVIYLQRSQSELVFQDTFEVPNTHHRFRVVRLWEQSIEDFLQFPGLMPFAVLGNSDKKEQVLQAVVTQIQGFEDVKNQENIAAATAILAGLVLEQSVIQRLLRKEIMKESVIYQDILAEGRAEGRVEGRVEGELLLLLRLLSRRFGSIDPSLEREISELSLEQIEALGDALMDFTRSEDLRIWLKSNV